MLTIKYLYILLNNDTYSRWSISLEKLALLDFFFISYTFLMRHIGSFMQAYSSRRSNGLNPYLCTPNIRRGPSIPFFLIYAVFLSRPIFDLLIRINWFYYLLYMWMWQLPTILLCILDWCVWLAIEKRAQKKSYRVVWNGEWWIHYTEYYSHEWMLFCWYRTISIKLLCIHFVTTAHKVCFLSWIEADCAT